MPQANQIDRRKALALVAAAPAAITLAGATAAAASSDLARLLEDHRVAYRAFCDAIDRCAEGRRPSGRRLIPSYLPCIVLPLGAPVQEAHGSTKEYCREEPYPKVCSFIRDPVAAQLCRAGRA